MLSASERHPAGLGNPVPSMAQDFSDAGDAADTADTSTTTAPEVGELPADEATELMNDEPAAGTGATDASDASDVADIPEHPDQRSSDSDRGPPRLAAGLWRRLLRHQRGSPRWQAATRSLRLTTPWSASELVSRTVPDVLLTLSGSDVPGRQRDDVVDDDVMSEVMNGAEVVGTVDAAGEGTSLVPAPGRSRSQRGITQVHPDAPAAVLMVDLATRTVLYANDVSAQMAPGLSLPVSVDEWAAAADLRDLDGEPLDETAHPLSRIARFEPVAGQGVSAARRSDLGGRRNPLWVVALPLDDAPNLDGHALVVFLPVRDREQLQQRADIAHAHARANSVDGDQGGQGATTAAEVAGEGVAVREAAVLATGLSFTVADARVPDMPLVWVNPAFTAVTGYTFEFTVGTNCRFLQGPGTDPEATRRIRTALRAGESITETLLNFRADGTAFWNQVAMSPVRNADGVLTHYVGIQTDVSSNVAADAERDRALAAEKDARAAAESSRAAAEVSRAEAVDAHARLALLAEVTQQLSEVIDPEDALDRLAHLVVPRLADFAIFSFVADGTPVPLATTAGRDSVAAGGRRGRHGLHDVAWYHHDPALREALDEHARVRLNSLTPAGRQALGSLMGPGPVGVLAVPDPAASAAPQQRDVPAQVAELLTPGAAVESLMQLAPTSMTTLPLRSRGRTLGLMTLATGAGRTPLAEADLALGVDIATRAGLALDRARLFRQQRDLAGGLQRSLLQLSLNAAPRHVQVAVRYVAAAEAAAVGGDFYDVFAQPAGAAVAVIGDVMGHDTEAAAAMSQLRTIVRTLGMVGDEDPRAVLTRADEVMRASGMDTTATATVVRLGVPSPDTAQERAEQGPPGSVVLQWSNAGHPPPVVLHADRHASLLEADKTDLLLGVNPGTARHLSSTRLAPGALLLLYTDGLVERRDQPLAEGIARLLTVLEAAARTCDELDGVLDAVLTQMLPAEASDDVALLAMCLR